MSNVRPIEHRTTRAAGAHENPPASETPREARRARRAWLAPYLVQHRGRLILACGLGLAASTFACALMFASGYLISGAAEARGSILLLYIPILYVRVFGGGKPFLAYAERLVSHDWVLRATSHMRLTLYETLERRSRAAAGGARSMRAGDVLGALTEDIGHLQNLYLRSLFPSIIAWALYAGALIALGMLSPVIAAAFGLGCAGAVIVGPMLSRKLNGPRERVRHAAKAATYATQTDHVLGLADWVCSGRREDYLAAGSRERAAGIAAERSGRSFDRQRDMLIQAAFGCVAVALLLWGGARFGGEAGVATSATRWIAAFVLGFFPLAEQFTPLSGAASEACGHEGAIDRLRALECPVDAGEVTSTRNTARKAANVHGESQRSAHDGKTLPRDPTIACRDASFTYPGAGRPALSGIDLVIPHGQHVAILGRSGAGKSTLAGLLRGEIRPNSGTVRFGDMEASSLAGRMPELIGIVQQQTYLFNTTLFDNLCVARADATRGQALEALERVGLGDLVERLPQGLDTMVDEGGMRFSGGERHRIALARILLRDTPIVLLDEPFASLDPITERELLACLRDVFADRTLLLITHHLAGVEDMDRVLFIEGGGVVMDGAPAELARTNERFRTLLAFDRGVNLAER